MTMQQHYSGGGADQALKMGDLSSDEDDSMLEEHHQHHRGLFGGPGGGGMSDDDELTDGTFLNFILKWL